MSDIEKIHRLLSRRKELSESELKDFAERIATLEIDGLVPTDIFPLGIIGQDGAGARFEVGTAAEVGRIAEVIYKAGGPKAQLEVTSVGIVDNRFRVQATIGKLS